MNQQQNYSFNFKCIEKYRKKIWYYIVAKNARSREIAETSSIF